MAEATVNRQVLDISEINMKLKKDGKTPMWNIVAGDKGDFYSVFDATVAARLSKGQQAVMVEEKIVNGKAYRNVIGIAEPDIPASGVDMSELVPNGKPVGKTVETRTPHPTVVNNMADIRAQALHNAVLLAAAGVIQVKSIEPQMNTFVNVILYGKDVEHNNGSITADDVEQFVDGG